MAAWEGSATSPWTLPRYSCALAVPVSRVMIGNREIAARQRETNLNLIVHPSSCFCATLKDPKSRLPPESGYCLLPRAGRTRRWPIAEMEASQILDVLGI